MTPNQLKSRQKFIKATPLADRASCRNTSRREKNHIEEEESHSETFDTFFEYEEELSQLKPSNLQSDFDPDEPNSYGFIEMETSDEDSIIIESIAIKMEESEDIKTNKNSYMVMEEDSGKADNYMDVKGFDFIQCEYMKKDGNRCKRQAPNGFKICSIHKKMIEKSSNN